MQDEGVERYGGTKDVADSHKFDEKPGGLSCRAC